MCIGKSRELCSPYHSGKKLLAPVKDFDDCHTSLTLLFVAACCNSLCCGILFIICTLDNAHSGEGETGIIIIKIGGSCYYSVTLLQIIFKSQPHTRRKYR